MKLLLILLLLVSTVRADDDDHKTPEPECSPTVLATKTPTQTPTPTKTDVPPTTTFTPTQPTFTATPTIGVTTAHCLIHTNKYVKNGGVIAFRSAPKIVKDGSIQTITNGTLTLSLPQNVVITRIYPEPTFTNLDYANQIIWTNLQSPVGIKVFGIVQSAQPKDILVTRAHLESNGIHVMENKKTTVR